MTESTNPSNETNPTDQASPTSGDGPSADETFTWTDEPGHGGPKAGATAADILESVRGAVDDLAERAGPTVRELSARAAELTAVAADRAAPLARRAGEVTAEVSGKLAARSREWASELRAAVPGGGEGAPGTDVPGSGSPGGAAPTPGFEPAEGAREPSGSTEQD